MIYNDQKSKFLSYIYGQPYKSMIYEKDFDYFANSRNYVGIHARVFT